MATTTASSKASSPERIAAIAEAWLEKHFDRTREPTRYIAGFKIGGGKEIALERTRLSLSVWVSTIPPGLTGLRVQNPKFPGQPYEATQDRNSNLRSVTPTLGAGRFAYHLELEDLGVLERLIRT